MRKGSYKNLLKLNTVILVLSLMLNIIFIWIIIHLNNTQAKELDSKIQYMTEINKERESSIKAQIAAEYETAIQEIFTQEEISYAMQRRWKYIISVNGEEIKNNKKYVNAGNIRIMIAEVINSHSIFSEELQAMGTLDKNNLSLPDLIEVYSVVPYTLEYEASEEGNKYYYVFEDVPKETMIVLTLSPLLTEKLDY